MCIYMGVRKVGPFKFQKSGHSYTFFKGVYHIPGGTEKGGYSARTSVLCHIQGNPLLRGFKPFMVHDLLKRR